jgi:hypothetical protein
VFNLASVLTTLKRYSLQLQNLNWITTIINNWPNDPRQNYTPNVNLKDYLKIEVVIAEENYELIKEVEFFEELHVYEY